MRRITKISIDNYRAYIQPLEINLSQGEDLLIYGENGSGKSSLYKAVRYFLESSVDNTKPFEVNHFSGRTDGNVSVTYTECDANRKLQAGTEQTYTISTDNAQTNNDQDFIKTSHRASGFLDYSQLLKVYLNNGKRPNLFVFITELLGNYVPVGFDTRTLREILRNSENKLRNAYHRTDYMHQEGLADFRKLEVLFPKVISQLNAILTPMMSRYFAAMGLDIELVGAKVLMHDPNIKDNIRVQGEVFIEVKHHGNQLPGYNERLNEARLSAIATCLYLSSLKLIAQTNDTRVLFLDDVFIGLDLGNRLPVLDIVKDEFKEYQRIITTYDKNWFLHAKEVLEEEGGWKFFEMYEGEYDDAAGQHLTRPILIENESLYGRACSLLNHPEHPDYPAAANYLRKSFEKLLLCDLYDKAIRDKNYEELPAHSLTPLVCAARKFVSYVPDYVIPQVSTAKLLTDLAGLLHALLHPLSHYVPDIPTYKVELKKAMNIYEGLKSEFQHSDYLRHCQVLVDMGKKMEFVVKGTSFWEYHYVLKLRDNLYLYDNNQGGKSLSPSEMFVTMMYWFDTLGVKKSKSIGEENAARHSMVYSSLQDCYDKVLDYLVNVDKKTDIIAQPLDEMFFISDDNNVPHTLKQVLATM